MEPQGLRRPKQEVLEDYAEEAKRQLELEEYERQARRMASFDDPEDTPGMRAAELVSIEAARQDAERRAMAGSVHNAIRASTSTTAAPSSTWDPTTPRLALATTTAPPQRSRRSLTTRSTSKRCPLPRSVSPSAATAVETSFI